MRLEIRYANEFVYDEAVTESHNLLRACPANTETQTLISYRVEVEPGTPAHYYADYWGTRVDEFAILSPHTTLRVFAESTVETRAHPAPEEEVALADYRGVAPGHTEYLLPSPHARWDGAISSMAAEVIGNAEGAIDAVTQIQESVGAVLSYAPGATFVGMDISDVLDQGKGVCQDFAHLAIAMYRSAGIPARYVSGYLYASDQTVAVTPTDPEVEIQTHAWVEVLIPGFGWWALDPTNHQRAGELHIKIGHGRDYEDVMPLRGVYHGMAAHALGVRVQITRERLGEMAQQ